MRGINGNHVSSTCTEPGAYGLLAGLLVLLLGLLAWDTGCAFYARPSAAPRPLQTQGDYAVKVEALCVTSDPFVDGTMNIHGGYGSGVIIDARHVLTAYHVANCAYLPDVHVVLASGRRLRMYVDKEWPQRDVARLVIASAETFGDMPPPRFAAPVPDAAACSATAFPERGGNCGQVLKTFEMHCSGGDGLPCGDARVSMIVNRGNSGSGVYDADGALVGLVTGGTFDMDGQPTGEGLITSLWDIRNEVMS